MACATRLVIRQRSRIICVLCSKLKWPFYDSETGFKTFLDKIYIEELLLKLRKACEPDGISNECLLHLSRRPLVHLTLLFDQCFRVSHFLKPWQEAKVITLPKPSKDPKFPQNLCLISLFPSTVKLFEKVILQMVQMHTEERGLLNASQFGFRAHHSLTLHCRRLMDQVTLNFNNNMSMAAVFLDTEKAVMFLSIYPVCGRMKRF
jgi:hypothetical protein